LEDLRNQKLKELSWESDKIRKAVPDSLFMLFQNYFEFTKETIQAMRLETQDLKDYQAIGIEWGKWSNKVNIIVRQRIKECDLFPDNVEKRFEVKKLNLIYLFWWKAAHYIDAFNCPLLGVQPEKLFGAQKEMEDIKQHYYYNTFMEELPSWVKGLNEIQE